MTKDDVIKSVCLFLLLTAAVVLFSKTAKKINIIITCELEIGLIAAVYYFEYYTQCQYNLILSG